MYQHIIQYAKRIQFAGANILGRVNFQLPEKYKGTFLERWHKYWTNLVIDYKEVGVDTIEGIRKRPGKALAYFSGLSLMAYCVKTNPDEHNFRSVLISYMNDVSEVAESLRSRPSKEHLDYLEKCHNANVLRRLNVGVMSFIWVDNYDSVCKLYKAQCDYLKPRYTDFYKRVVDVGFLNTWWGLRHYMQEYDVNNEEWDKPV